MDPLKPAKPDWDMTAYFPAFGGPEYRDFRSRLEHDVKSLQEQARALGRLERSRPDGWAKLLLALEDVAARAAHIGSYLGCLGSADSRDEAVQGDTAGLSVLRSDLEKATILVRAAFRETEASVLQELLARDDLREVAFYLSRIRERAAWSMSTELETLAAELDPVGLSAWSRLYDNVSGKLEFDLELAGKPARRLPVSVTRSLLEDPDPEVRRAAFAGSNAAWERAADALAPCLNAIAGTRLALYRRRGVPHFLDPALFDACISRRTLDTLLDVVRARQDVPRRYLRRKARILGRERLGFQDLLAPLPFREQKRISWEGARERVLAAFGGFYPKLAEFAQVAFERRWIDHAPRAGKRPGGFCSSSALIEESRVFMTFDGPLGDVSTLAHELGHAFHASLMRGLRPFARRTPMTLAETASTFAEQLLIDQVLEDPKASRIERAATLDRRVQDASLFLVNIPMRFDFEKAFYEERARGELGIGRLKELMLDAQRRNYGDALYEDELDPWFWASKLHFYGLHVSFYNFPYTFGYLFSLGIFARAKQEGPSFLPRYEELLRSTGLGSAEEVARRCLGVELEKPDFWNASIDLVEADLELFLVEADELFPQAASGSSRR